MRKYYVYWNHCDESYYWSDEDLALVKDDSYFGNPLHCEECGDFDLLVGFTELDFPPTHAQMEGLNPGFKPY